MNGPSRLLAELSRRRVFKTAVAYLVAAWVLIEVADVVLPRLGAPEWTVTLIIVVAGAGLPVALVLSWVFDLTGDGVRRSLGGTEPPPDHPRPGIANWAMLALVLVLAGLGVGAGYRLVRDEAPGRPDSIAVLPFDDLSQDRSQAYFADGLAEELLTALAGIEGLRVASRSSSFQFREDRPDVREVGARLGVEAVVEGGVRQDGERLLVTIQLVDASSGYQLWSRRFDRPAHDVFAVQEEIARAITETLEVAAEPAAPLIRRGTSDLAAYDHYLRGNFLMVERTPEGVLRAIEEYRTAAEIDPGFTAAVLRQAYAYAIYADWNWPHPESTRNELLALSDALSERALARDSSSAEAWLVRGYLYTLRDPHRMAGAADALRRSAELEPDDAEVWHQLGQTLMVLGRWEEAEDAYRRVLHLEPDRPLTLVPLAAIAVRRGHIERGLAWNDSALARSPNPYALAHRATIHLLRGRPDLARADAELGLELGEGHETVLRSLIAAAEAAAGDSASATAELSRALEGVDLEVPSLHAAVFAALAYVHLERPERAVDLIERARPRGAWLWFYLQDPTFEVLREDPRFRRLEADLAPRP